jgi:PDZ domain-containing protein
VFLPGFFSIVLSVWVGIGFTPQANGVRVDALPYLSPAAKAGVHVGDIIVGVDDREFNGDPATIGQAFRDFITNHSAGDEVTLRILRDEVVEIKVALEERPLGVGRVKEFPSFDSFPKTVRAEEQVANRLIDEFKITPDYKDLRQRLALLSERGDQFRLARVAYIQREPFQLRTVAATTLDQLGAATAHRDVPAIYSLATAWLDASGAKSQQALKTGLNLEEHLNQIVSLMEQAEKTREQAFAKLSDEDRKYLEDNCDRLFDNFADAKDLDPRVLEIAARVDMNKIIESGTMLWSLSGDAYLDDLQSALRKAWEAAGKPQGIFINRDSPVGKIIVGGDGNTWYTDDAAILLDLAGRDFYTNNAGASRGNKMPNAILIDFAGDDSYEATRPWSQGAGKMGHGVLIDRSGNDEYIGTQWTQGAALLGTALFLDQAGNDTYRADQYAQAVAVWGIASHVDYDGDDTYESRLLSQGVGLPGGAGWLIDGRGNDRYYAKGKHATEYGDAGIFDSWSQASGIGFRGYESGGVAILYDGGGADRYEAGNFSQGGGYYFGIGLLRDAGRENDVYIGSRYNQGFAAHESIGYFEEAGGNDFYTTRQAVAQGVAWDEAIVAFIDHDGDDVYEGGASFSQGASAHNGFVLFLDLGGRNRFVYAMPQGLAGPNDYHGGKSLSVFLSEGRGNSIHGDAGIAAGLSRRELRDLR